MHNPFMGSVVGGNMQLPKENFFRLEDGSHMYFELHGAGIPVVLLHGWSLSGKVFYKNVPEIAKRYQVIIPDLRGHGWSSKELQGNTIDQYAKDIHALLEYLGIKKFVLCGWSLSVVLALRYIEMFEQDNLLGVALLDGSCAPFCDESWNAHKLSGYNMDGMVEKFQALMQDPERMIRQNAEGWFKYKERNQDEIALFEREQKKTPVWISYAIYSNYMMYDESSVLKSLRVPVIIMVPTYNKLRGEHEAALVGNAELHFLTLHMQCFVRLQRNLTMS
jgi:pimeloyl-ACP methyl ester carboxylesterase